MKYMAAIEKIIICVLVGLLVLILVGSWSNSTDFRAACEEARGKVAYDGRQYQCIKP